MKMKLRSREENAKNLRGPALSKDDGAAYRKTWKDNLQDVVENPGILFLQKTSRSPSVRQKGNLSLRRQLLG